MAILNPATGKQIAAVPDGSRADVDRAVQAAKTAFYDGRWSRKTPGERSLALFRLADLLEQNGAEIGRVESENAGKPYAQLTMAGDIPFAVDNLRFFAAAARDTHGSRAGRVCRRLHFHVPPRAGGRGRPDCALELSAADGGVEAGPGPGGGLHDRAQARTHDPARAR